MSLANLRRRLYEKDFLNSLLWADQNRFDPPEDLKDIQWEVLPYYLPFAYPRITFHLHTKDGEYLLKLNTETIKIHREAAACRQFYSFNSPALTVPRVYAVEVQVPLHKYQSCGWLITEWVNGISAVKVADEVLVSLLPQGLLYLHEQAIDESTVETIYGLKMPGHTIALEILRKRRREYFEQVLEVCSQKLIRSIRQLEEMVCAHPFTDHLSFIHGDLHVNNIKYHQEAHEAGYRLFLFDWEDVSIDHPLCDLANLMFSDGFSRRSQQCLDAYISLVNKLPSEFGPLSLLDAWMLAAVCFARNLRWKFSTVLHDDQQKLEREAEQAIEKIISQYLCNS